MRHQALAPHTLWCSLRCEHATAHAPVPAHPERSWGAFAPLPPAGTTFEGANLKNADFEDALIGRCAQIWAEFWDVM